MLAWASEAAAKVELVPDRDPGTWLWSAEAFSSSLEATLDEVELRRKLEDTEYWKKRVLVEFIWLTEH